jgi:LacI family transcriptional regulator
VTLQDVADRAGVSLTTASRVVNDGARRVGKTLADRVNKAVADLGYTANLQARAVATGCRSIRRGSRTASCPGTAVTRR